MVSKEDLLKMNRREVIQSLTGLGLSIPASYFMTREGLAELDFNPETEVPRIHGWKHTNHEDVVKNGAVPQREPVYETISKDHWRMVEAGRNARRRVSEALSDMDPAPVVVSRVPDGSDHLNPRTIVVKHVTITRSRNGKEEVVTEPDYTPRTLRETVKDRLPDVLTGVAGPGTESESRVDGIPIVIETEEREESAYDYDYRDDGVPAGCAHDVSGGGGTIGTPAVDTDLYKKVFIGSGHVLAGHSKVYQNSNNDSGDYLGDVNNFKTEKGIDFDAGVINNLQYDRAFKYAANYPDTYHGPQIYGSQPKSALDDMAGTGETIYKQGEATGKESGTVKGVTDKDSFEAYINEANGDSGGPYWVEKSNYSLISGIHWGSSSAWSVGTIMEAIEDRFNVSV